MAFKEWIVMHDWSEVYTATGSNDKTNAYKDTLERAINAFFLLKTNHKKSSDLPWISRSLLKEICLLYTSPSPRDRQKSRMPSSA